MEFFLYYVLWPFILGAGFFWVALFQPEFVIHWLVGWIGVWLVWPIGKYRRRHQKIMFREFQQEAEKTGEINGFAALVLSLGPTVIMILAVYTGLAAMPVLLEQAGIDAEAKLKEYSERVQRERHQGSSPLPK